MNFQPTRWEVGGPYDRKNPIIEAVPQRDGSRLFAVRDFFGSVLSVKGEWTHEALPSSRPATWTKTHRFTTIEEAITAASEHPPE